MQRSTHRSELNTVVVTHECSAHPDARKARAPAPPSLHRRANRLAIFTGLRDEALGLAGKARARPPPALHRRVSCLVIFTETLGLHHSGESCLGLGGNRNVIQRFG